eukprot:15335686-Alexandrium_andersonii.AAC.1
MSVLISLRLRRPRRMSGGSFTPHTRSCSGTSQPRTRPVICAAWLLGLIRCFRGYGWHGLESR